MDGRFNWHVLYNLENGQDRGWCKANRKDLEDIQLNPIVKFFQDGLKCIQDSISYFL